MSIEDLKAGSSTDQIRPALSGGVPNQGQNHSGVRIDVKELDWSDDAALMQLSGTQTLANALPPFMPKCHLLRTSHHT